MGAVINSQIEVIVKQILDRHKRLDKAKQDAKTRDKKRCLVTGEKPDKINSFKLAAHHLYSQSGYPHLADSVDNLITIKEEVHEQFHQHYMAGTCKSCTLDDFVNFVQQYYPDNYEVVTWLENQRRKLGHQQPVDIQKPHVLYLPASRVS